MQKTVILALLALVMACDSSVDDVSEPAESEKAEPIQDSVPSSSDQLGAVLGQQPDETKARYQFRHPQETLEFFGIEPGMTVMEALPGGGWYTKSLLPYLGSEGHLIGVDYALDMWAKFPFYNDEMAASKKIWTETWTADAEGWRGDNGAKVTAFVFGSKPGDASGQADAVLFIRALHNMARFESDGGYLTTALSDAYDVLKPGGIAGVVQHHARDNMPDEWANGSNGYLKRSFVIDAMKKAGFEYVGESDINANALDQPTEEDIVWRLAPSFATSRDNPELQATLKPIGESNRMTLKFRKPN